MYTCAAMLHAHLQRERERKRAAPLPVLLLGVHIRGPVPAAIQLLAPLGRHSAAARAPLGRVRAPLKRPPSSGAAPAPPAPPPLYATGRRLGDGAHDEGAFGGRGGGRPPRRPTTPWARSFVLGSTSPGRFPPPFNSSARVDAAARRQSARSSERARPRADGPVRGRGRAEDRGRGRRRSDRRTRLRQDGAAWENSAHMLANMTKFGPISVWGLCSNGSWQDSLPEVLSGDRLGFGTERSGADSVWRIAAPGLDSSGEVVAPNSRKRKPMRRRLTCQRCLLSSLQPPPPALGGMPELPIDFGERCVWVASMCPWQCRTMKQD